MIGGVTRTMLPHLSGFPHLHVNRPLEAVFKVGQFCANVLISAFTHAQNAPDHFTFLWNCPPTPPLNQH